MFDLLQNCDLSFEGFNFGYFLFLDGFDGTPLTRFAMSTFPYCAIEARTKFFFVYMIAASDEFDCGQRQQGRCVVIA